MAKSLGGFRAALLIGWAALSAAGILYARFKDIPNWAAVPVIAAFLVEYPFYLLSGFTELRKQLAGARLPAFLVVSTVLPYLTCFLINGQFQFPNLMRLAALAVALSLWYLVLPVNMGTDLAFLAFIAVVFFSRYFDRIYTAPYPGLDITILGRLALIQITVLVLLLQRRMHGTGYGFLPNRREWQIGALHYLYFLPAAACIVLPLNVMHLSGPGPLWKAAGTFLGFLWVAALFEEFVFRGVLQQWLEEWIWSRTAALILTSGVFGLAHLWFRGFPNWRWAIIAAVLGGFCGSARNQAGSIRASVVTHALVVTTWRTFFV